MNSLPPNSTRRQAALKMDAMDIPAELTRLHGETVDVFEKLHAVNNDARQQNPNLRQAVALASAAVAALQKAARCAQTAFNVAE